MTREEYVEVCKVAMTALGTELTKAGELMLAYEMIKDPIGAYTRFMAHLAEVGRLCQVLNDAVAAVDFDKPAKN